MQGDPIGLMSPGLIGYRILAYTSLGLAIAGIVLPLLPTTPFVLLAAWSAGRSSPEFHRWLHNHRTFGPIIENWKTRRAVPMRAKWLACAMLLLSWGMLFASGASIWLLAGLAVFFCGLLVFLFTRPSR
ncbi:hypothetical protein RE428_37990 [Marinobacter nanhaiticus D15-8W]|nr:YbaN family protein [Marinobacter nanhaiticus]BES72781.1 hypothetical protein RE428_37990 [Marinobacter nanhaiticus D15-8W]